MATGYTSATGEKDGVTFEQFALSCARAFGAAIHMRDDPMDWKLKPAKKPDYHAKELRRSLARVQKLNKMSLSECCDKAASDYKERKASAESQIEAKNALRARYDKVLQSVLSYAPPTEEHAGHKKFMEEQLDTSIKFDYDVKYYEKALAELKPLGGKAWRAAELAKAYESAAYHVKHQAEDEERQEKSVAWIKTLARAVKKHSKKG